LCRSAAKSSTPDEREAFTRLAAGFKKAAAANDEVSFVRFDREFNELCMTAARNEFAEGAMRLRYGLSRRFWYYHYKQAGDLPEMASCMVRWRWRSRTAM
jgi:DNA-binding GntR family transcriptional regulator